MKKISLVIILTGFALFYSSNIYAGCENVCLSLDSIAYNSNLTDTANLQSDGGLRIFARYNGACRMILEGANPTMQLVWYKDGVPYDTTDLSDADYDNIWTYYTSFYITEPGVYEVYFMGFYQPDYPCKRILVLPAEMASIVNNENIEHKIYPNPADGGLLFIEIYDDPYIHSIEVLDLNGRKVFGLIPNGSNIISINTEEYPEGIYFVRINGSTRVVTRKFIVSHSNK